MKSPIAVALLLASTVADAATTVAVIELGKGGVVRRTTSTNSDSSVQDVESFWKALHSPGRKLQQPGMPVVPDLFSKSECGLVVALTGDDVELDSMPTVTKLMSEGDDSGAVGHLTLSGSQGDDLLNKLETVESVDPSSLVDSAKAKAEVSGLSGVKLSVTKETASQVDEQVAALLRSVDQQASESDKTIVLHLIVEGDSEVSLQRTTSRRLEDEAAQDEGEDDADGENQNGQKDGFYGYGYLNAYGEYVTPYKTMFQIQYFNVVLWTSVGLAVVLFFTVYLMAYMPLMADTLLFGESAKMIGDD